MAEIDLIKISELPATSTIGDADELAVVQGGATKKVPYSVLKDGTEVTPDTTLSEAGVPADAAAVGAALALKANQAAVTQALAAKADKTEVAGISDDIAELASVVETKADQTALNQKADKTTTDALRQDLTTLNGIVNQKADKTELNTQIGNVTSELATKANTADVNNLLAAKANIASPVFAGRPQAPTAAKGTATLQLATTAFVQNAIDDKEDKLTFNQTPTQGSTNPVTSGGVWEAVQTDKTLTVEDKAADAKKTGVEINYLKSAFDALNDMEAIPMVFSWEHGGIDNTTGQTNNDGVSNRSRDVTYRFVNGDITVVNGSSSRLWLIGYTYSDNQYAFKNATQIIGGATYTGHPADYVRFDIRGNLTQADMVSASMKSVIETEIESLFISDSLLAGKINNATNAMNMSIGASKLAERGTPINGDVYVVNDCALGPDGLAVPNATGYKVRRYEVTPDSLVYIKATLDYARGVVVQFQSNRTVPNSTALYDSYVISNVKTEVDSLLIIPNGCTWILISMASDNTDDTVTLIDNSVMDLVNQNRNTISAKLDGRFTTDSPTENKTLTLTGGKTFYAPNGTFVNNTKRAVSGITQASNTDISIQVTSGYKMWVYGNNTGSGKFFSQSTDWAETMSFSDLDYAFYVVVVKRNDDDVITSDDLTNVLTGTYATGFAPYLSESEIIELCKETQWKGKKIVWFGTSIPAGLGSLKYPNLLGQKLGATVYNEAIGSSMIRAGFADKATTEDPLGILDGTSRYGMLYSLSQTVAEKANIIDNWAENKSKFLSDQYSAVPDTIAAEERAKIISCSYENKVDKYLSTGSIGVCDLYVFDHGVNESWRTEDLSELPAPGVDERLYTVGAFDFIIRRILADNPKANIVILTNYENQYRTGICEMQELVASRWAIPCIKIYDKFGWSQQIVNGKTMLNNALPDGLHPFSDTTGKATYKYVDVLYNEFKKLSAYW